MTYDQPKWRRLTAWPEFPERHLGLPAGTGDFVRGLFADDRLRLELLDKGRGEREVRIPCRRGELYPVGATRWGWIGPGGTWTRRVMTTLGADATSPVGGSVTPGTGADESAVWFPTGRLGDVARVVGAKRRRSGGGRPFAPRQVARSEAISGLESIPMGAGVL